MLVSKKQEWDLYQEQPVIDNTAQQPVVNTVLRVKLLTVVTLLALIAMFITVRSEAIIGAGYDLVQSKAQLIKAERENELLRLDIAKLKSPQRIQAIATKELGMVVPPDVYHAAGSAPPKPETQESLATESGQGMWAHLAGVFGAGKGQ